jgi:hypothetical protein
MAHRDAGRRPGTPGLGARGLYLGLPRGAAGQRRGHAVPGRPCRLALGLRLWRRADPGRHRGDAGGARARRRGRRSSSAGARGCAGPSCCPSWTSPVGGTGW